MAASVWITLMEMDPWFVGALALPPPGGANWKPWSPPWELSAPSLGAAEDATLMVRFSVETMPSVTVPVRPSGEPMATAVSPTLSLPESPERCRDQPGGVVDLDDGEVRERVGSDDLGREDPCRRCVRTSMAALAALPSRVTTWVLVRMWPSSSRMMPEPVPPSLPLVALMVTTLGEALTAAAVMALTSSLLLTMTGPGLAAGCSRRRGVAGRRRDCRHRPSPLRRRQPGGEDAGHEGADAEAALRLGALAGLFESRAGC